MARQPVESNSRREIVFMQSYTGAWATADALRFCEPGCQAIDKARRWVTV